MFDEGTSYEAADYSQIRPQAMRAVWLYGMDEDATRVVDTAPPGIRLFTQANMKDKVGMAAWGREFAGLTQPQLRERPMELVQDTINRLRDGDMYYKYSRELAAIGERASQVVLNADGSISGQPDTADDYYELYAKIHRDVEETTWRTRREKQASMEHSLANAMRYVQGEALVDTEKETGAGAPVEGFTERDLENLRAMMSPERLADIEGARAFAQTYLSPLAESDDAEYMLRNLDALEDELHDYIDGSDSRAQLAYEMIMGWAEKMKQSNKVGVTDEFVISVGKKLKNWSRVPWTEAFRFQGGVGAAGAITSPTSLVQAGRDLQENVQDANKKQRARSILRAGVNKALELGDAENWFNGVLRTGSQMLGDTSMYLLPYVGMYAGTLDTLVGGVTETYDMNSLNPELSEFDVAARSGIDTLVQAGVELLPFGHVGGKGLSAFLKRFAKDGVEEKVNGTLARWAVRTTQKSTARAAFFEGAAAFVDEAVLEPVVGGLAKATAEELIYKLAPEGEETRGLAEQFNELKEIWTDSKQFAGLVLFTAALTGAHLPRLQRNVQYFSQAKNFWIAEGLTEEQAETVVASDDPFAKGQAMVQEEFSRDPEGYRERRLNNNKDLLERGEVLFMTGEGALDAEMENDVLAPVYRELWQDYVQRKWLPEVRANADGTFTATTRFANGKTEEVTLDGQAMDNYLQNKFDQVEETWLKKLQKDRSETVKRPNLKAEILRSLSEIGSESMLRSAQEKDVVRVEDVTRQLPPELAGLVKDAGGINAHLAGEISRWARGVIDGLTGEGMSEAEARASRSYAAGAVMSLGSWADFAQSFATRGRLEDAGNVELSTALFRTRGDKESVVDGRRVLGSTLFNAPGFSTAFGVVEDTAESVLDEIVQARAAVLKEQQEQSDRQAEETAWTEMADLVGKARAAVLKADPKLHVPEPEAAEPMSVIEAFSAMARSNFVMSKAAPRWMRPLVAAMKGTLSAAGAIDATARAWDAALATDPAAVGPLMDTMEKVGVRLEEAFRDAVIEQADVVAWRVAHGIVMSKANGPDGAGGMPVSEVVQDAQEEEQAILEREAPAPEERVEEVKQEMERGQDYAERVTQMGEPVANAPEPLKGVFVGDNCNYNPAGGFYFGRIEKGKIVRGTEQVKVGAKGKHGVIAGRELTGNFQATAAPLYVWRRKNGELWLISGRHRFELMMRDDAVQDHTCYVFLEDEQHDERWARMLDYENNMRDDQADEVTAATYVRETGLSDTELEVRGLMRNASRSKRGALIGRHAREELWTRFSNGKVSPKDAEIVCNLTRYIKDQGRVDEIQRRCCMLLDEGKGWDFIGGMVQLMANKESVLPKQGLLDFGADFEADLARAAEWIEKNLAKVKEAITLLKQGRKLSGKKRAEAERLGVATTTTEASLELLHDLEQLRGKFEMIGSYPDLVAQAQLWDGESEVDPVGQYLAQVQAERRQDDELKEMNADEYLQAQQAEATGELFSMSMERGGHISRAYHDVEAAPAVRVSFPNVYIDDIAKAKDSVKSLYDELRKNPVTMKDGRIVNFTSRGFKEVSRHAGDRRVLAAIVKMRELSKTAVYLDSAPNTEKHIPSKRNIEHFHYYLSKGNFPEFREWARGRGIDAGESGDAFVLIVVAEKTNGDAFYDLDATDVVEVENNKGTADILAATRIPNPGRQDSVPKGRIHRIKEYVNYIDSKGENNLSFSVREAKNQGMFRDGILEASNAVVTEPGFSFSIEALHVTPHKFRKFSTEYMGSGEGAQAYGWGLYFMESKEVNKVYYKSFTRKVLTVNSEFKKLYDAARDLGVDLSPSIEAQWEVKEEVSYQRLLAARDLEYVQSQYDKLTKKVRPDAFWRNRLKRELQSRPKGGFAKLLWYYTSWRKILNDYKFRRDHTSLKYDIKFRQENRKKIIALLKQAKEKLKAVEDLLEWVSQRFIIEEQVIPPTNLRVEINVDDSNLFMWDELISDALYKEVDDIARRVNVSIPREKASWAGKASGAGAYRILARVLGSAEKASMWLAERGYKGIKYLDGMSRRNGKGTYNYVIFSGDDVKITGVNETGNYNAPWEEYTDPTATFSVERAIDRSMKLLDSRSEEEVAQRVMDDLRAACERLAVVLADDNADARHGEGLRVYAELQALISAVRSALPEKYLKIRWLNARMRWASVYAKMAMNGEIPASGTITNERFEKFVSWLKRQAEREQLQGWTEEEQRDALMELAGQKLDSAFLRVTKDCVNCLDQFIKDRALERIEWLYKHAFPTREEGRAWGRGKMDTPHYNLINQAMEHVQDSLGQRRAVEEELKAIRRAMVAVRAQMKQGVLDETEGRRKLKALEADMAAKEREAQQAAADLQASRIESLTQELSKLEETDTEQEEETARYNEQMALQQTFGNWYYKSALDARRAARVFEDMVLRGKKQWQEKLNREREETAYWRGEISAALHIDPKEATNARIKSRNDLKAKITRKLMATGKGVMNFGHLMLSLRPMLGERFCDMQRELIAQMHNNTLAFNTGLKHWMYETLRDITGLKSEKKQEQWLQENNRMQKTGIIITERAVEKAKLSYQEAKRWLAMSPAVRDKERARLIAEARQEHRKPNDIPTEGMMDDLGKQVATYEKDNHGVAPEDKKFEAVEVREWETELETTKDAILFGILTFEQPDYERLMQPNGITPEVLEQMRRYVGPKMLQWGYAMRQKLGEHGTNVARVFEEYTGIPFDARENYFRGVFDQGAMKEQTVEQAVAAASGASGSGSKYGSLIPRRYHQSKINWDTSASGVFVTSIQQQNNYVQTNKMLRTWRTLLANKDFSKRVEAEIGAAAMKNIRGWLDLIEGAVAADVKMAEEANKIFQKFLGGIARAALGGNIRTLIKQVSALLNGFAGGYVPDHWILNNEVCREFTYRHIGFGEFMMALARVLSMRGSVSREDAKGQAYIYARTAQLGDGLLHVTHLAANQVLPGQVHTEDWLGWKNVPIRWLAWLGDKSNTVVETAMNAIAKVDAEMCTASAMAVADVAYRNAVEQDKAGLIPDDVKRAEALRIAGMALDVAAQPQLRTQKGYWAASGAFGGMGDFLFMFRSDTLSKAGLWIAQSLSGEKLSAFTGILAFGVMNSLVLAFLEGLRGNLPDDDEEPWKLALTFGMNVLTNDIAAMPIAGDALRKLRAVVLGERYYESGSLVDLVPFGEVVEYGKREVRNIRKGASWDRHWNATAGLLRALGSSCAVCQESTIGPLANLSSLTMAAAVLGNATQFVEGLIKLAEELND